MDGLRPGDLAIVDFKLGGTETRTMTYGGGGGGIIVNGSGHLSGGWVRSEAIQTNTIPMPDGSIRKATLNPDEDEMLPGSRLSAACFMGLKGRWQFIAIRNHETGKTLMRTFRTESPASIDMQPRYLWLRILGPTIVFAALLAGVFVGLAALFVVVFGALPPQPLGPVLVLGLWGAGVLFAADRIAGRVWGKLRPRQLERRARALLDGHEWGGDR